MQRWAVALFAGSRVVGVHALLDYVILTQELPGYLAVLICEVRRGQ